MHVTTDRFLTFATKPTLGLSKCAPRIAIRAVSPPAACSHPRRYTMHPSEPHWLLATNRNNELLLSQDLGTTWKSIGNRVSDFAWGRTAGEGWSKDSIVAAMLEDDAFMPLDGTFAKSLSL